MFYCEKYSDIILTNFFAEPTVLLVPITSRVLSIHIFIISETTRPIGTMFFEIDQQNYTHFVLMGQKKTLIQYFYVTL
jgi:hypothetical protein